MKSLKKTTLQQLKIEGESFFSEIIDVLPGEGHGEAGHDNRVEIQHLRIHVQGGEGSTSDYNALEPF